MMGSNHIVSNQGDDADLAPISVSVFDEEGVYTIKVKGRLAAHWTESLGNLALSYDDAGDTLLAGTVADQSALHGILAQIRNLGLTLLSVTRLGTE